MPRQKPLNCGNTEHPLECLCDVIITEVKPITVTLPYDVKYGKAITDHLDIGVPWSSKDLADFLEMLGKIQDMARRPSEWGDRQPMKPRDLKKLNEEQLTALKNLIKSKIKPTPITRIMETEYGVSITRSYVCKTRTRMVKRGELNAD